MKKSRSYFKLVFCHYYVTLLSQFVVCGGSPRRMEIFAHYMLKELKLKLPAGQTLMNIAGATDRYALYKAGPVLSASVSTMAYFHSCHVGHDVLYTLAWHWLSVVLHNDARADKAVVLRRGEGRHVFPHRNVRRAWSEPVCPT